MEKEIIKNIVDQFATTKVCVIGDSIIDISYNCESIGVSLETPTLKAKLNDTTITPGGAFGVAANLSQVINNPYFITVVGADDQAVHLSSVSHNLILQKIYDSTKQTTVKRRYWVSRGESKYKYFQLNTECKKDISSPCEQQLIATMTSLISHVDCMVLSDYRNGVLTQNVISSVLAESKKHNIPVIINSQISSNSLERFYDFVGCSLLILNEEECEKIKAFFNCGSIIHLADRLKCDLCITQGSRGSTLILKGEVYYQKAFTTKVVDTCGAGDSFLAILAASNVFKYPSESLRVANAWASLFVSTSKDSVPTLFDLKKKLKI